MQKFPIILVIFITSTIVFGIGFLSNLMPSQSIRAQALAGPSSDPVDATIERAQPEAPDIPAIVDELYFGVPAGNGHRPRLLALDSQQERIYTFNEGLVELPEGNTISVIDLDTDEIIDLIKLNNKQETGFALPTPLDLQVDPFRPRLYAIWGDLYGDVADTTLTVIDTDSLTVVETLPGVEAIAPGPERLYLANDSRLWAAEPGSLSELESRDLELRQLNEGLLFSSETNRLYLRRGQPWSLEIFAADTLASLNSYPTPNELLHVALNETGERLFVIEKTDTQAQLQALDRDGQPLSASVPTPIADNVYGELPLAFSDNTLYLVDQDPDTFAYRLRSFTLPRLRPLDSLPLPTLPNELLLEPDSGLIYAAFDHPSSYLLEINPATEATQTIFTALEIVDALANPNREHLYVLNDAATLQILDPTGYDEIAQVDTGHDLRNSQNRFLAELSLDPGRNRLYLSGAPVRVIETDTFDVTAYPDLQGQLTPDPSGERVYLTPPCECRQEQCNTFVLKAETLTGTQTLFPPEDPFTAPCVYATRLDSENQLLYTLINNGVAGSNSGSYFTVFDTAPPGPPQQVYTNTSISYGSIAFDPSGQRAYLSRYRQDRSFIQGFGASLAQGSVETISQTLQLGGAQGDLVFDPQFDRLYAVNGDAIQVFDSDLTLLAETTLPGEFELLTFDPQNQRLYLSGANAQMLVVATSGGQLELPPAPPPATDQTEQQRLFIAPDGTLFRIDGWQLFRSTDEGQSWQRLGRGLPDRLVNDLAISPSYAADQTLLVGLWDFGRGGGLYRSSDGGDTWRPTTRGLTDLEIEQIIFSPTFAQDQTVFLTTLEDGLFRSTDGGDTWVSLAGKNTEHRVSYLAVSPTFAEDDLLIFGYRELLRSTDGGDSWSSLGLPAGRVAFSPDFANDGLVLSEGRWRSTDRGQTWQPAAAGREAAPFGIEKFIFSPDFASDQTVYILFQTRMLQRSVDAGRAWQSLLSGLPADFEVAAAAMFPTGELLLSSLDGQQLTVAPKTLTWGRPTVDIEQLDLQDLAIIPDQTIFVANSTAGVFKSTDEGRTWTETDFPARAFENQLARLALADDGTLFAAAGSAIERSEWSTDAGQAWTYLSDVPTSFSVASLAVSPDFAADGLVLAGGDFQQNQILRSADGGETWTVVFDGETVGGSSDVSLLAISPNVASDDTAYAWLQEGGLLRSTDRGRTWSLVFDEEAEGVRYFGQSLAVSPDAERLYLGALDGRLLVSEDGGQSWTDLGENIPEPRVWSSALALTNDGTIFLGTDIGVYRSDDEGQSWIRASSGLPTKPAQGTPPSIRALRLSGDRLYAALTEGGLYFSEDRGESWQSTLAGEAAAATQLPPTPAPISTPTRQPPASPASCASTPTYFSDLWARRVAQLGCPVEAQRLTMVEQTFEGGRMFWRSDLAAIYVLPTGAPYRRFDDTWDDSQPAYLCPDSGPSQTPPTPQRGFGKVWCDQPQIRRLLGQATGQEHPFEATLQTFETGLIFQTDQDSTFILESGSNNWERVEQ